ncbi:tryptophan synthase beta subunit-like PLP-dependent enzyme [Hygrophoropsis aurantiaca]|uniref:Tryptophan synthase beta subunit-like PLP-dependent enzyme n=1 Tax=Hygrophoropsis aurantiaca TaxID=72124 RepID=A0ACB8A332_9AGAM|nr:tryptophan synthase beta subunit-like PLP-dependent enzyme [Hygrophoropsis aurantiaca]
MILSLPPWPHISSIRQLTYGIIIGFSLSLSFTALSTQRKKRLRAEDEKRYSSEPRAIELRTDEIVDGVTGLIGNTPLVRINSLSDALGVEILGKAEFLNPGGSVKDRVALRMVEDAERLGLLRPHTGSRIFEGTVGSTGISIAVIAKARAIIMPDDVAAEKVQALEALGADVQRVRPASIVDKKQNMARQAAVRFGRTDLVPPAHESSSSPPAVAVSIHEPSVVVTTTSAHTPDGADDPQKVEAMLQQPRGFFADQFENRSNFDAHFEGTGPELWRQTNGQIDAFVSGAGTGGTIAGIGRYFKSMDEGVRVVLADPEGSGLYNKVKFGVMYDRKEAEGTKRRHQVDTVVEGIGINRMTNNVELALPIIDDAFRISDPEAVAMARYLVQHDGLFLGSSSACNLVACVKFVREMGWAEKNARNAEYLVRANIPVDTVIIDELLRSAVGDQ